MDKIISTKGRVIILICALVLFVSIVHFKHTEASPLISFNQNFIENILHERGVLETEPQDLTTPTFGKKLSSVFTHGDSLNIPEDFSNKEAMFSAVFALLPSTVTVYPTEGYFYFSIPSSDLSGNIRFAEIENGSASFGYFKISDVRNSDSFTISKETGYDISYDKSNNTARIKHNGKTVIFNLPKQITTAPADMQLLSEEKYVAFIQDESALQFDLIYNSESNGFYYILHTNTLDASSLQNIGNELMLDERTGYVFKNDTLNRNILVAISAQNILKNNYYDGPFDQVPPHLAFRDLLYKVYPYTQYLRGLDEHGNFYDFEGQRVAISPYFNYYKEDGSDTLQFMEGECADKTDMDLIACLTYESKKDFHKTLPDHFTEDGVKLK